MNDDIKLDSSFQLSFMCDIAKGMEFLHRSHLHSHGNMKSSNCLVDARWTVKVLDILTWNILFHPCYHRAWVTAIFGIMYFRSAIMDFQASLLVNNLMTLTMVSIGVSLSLHIESSLITARIKWVSSR